MTRLAVEVLNPQGGQTVYVAEGNTVSAAAEALVAKLNAAAVKAEDSADALRAAVRELNHNVLF